MVNLQLKAGKRIFHVTFLVALGAVSFYTQPAFSGEAAYAFTAKVSLLPPLADHGNMHTAFCRSKQSPTSHGSVAIVVCSTGAVVDVQGENDSKRLPIHGGAYRYVIDFNQAGKTTNTESNFNGVGTTTAWRIVNLSGKEYLEMMLGW